MTFNKYVKAFLATSCIIVATNAFSLNSSPTTTEDSETIESITVTGDGKAFYRQLMNLAEDDFFDLYNQITENEDLKVKCKTKNRHGFTRIKQRKCESAFVSRIKYDNVQVSIESGSRRTGALSSGTWMNRIGLTTKSYSEMKKLRKQQIEDLEQKIKDNPELQQKLIKLLQSKEKYKNAS
ncbi:MAG: hypothetical protein Alis3KO_07440 [Aliiglaciecola sp.]|uniref:YidC/Oxa1 family membrane protein insertase n=1 Tax=Aliiglaciecola sp. M165 TaxID=2593649 RepID=UPI00117BEFB1|nr:YidC/Oxa1 family membrane protein insertase [Aliiglaciecola sp. M165]TRY29345.1 YidC/Oxa1 family membrane protein insertase [Aliiglaciecola sp. M165]